MRSRERRLTATWGPRAPVVVFGVVQVVALAMWMAIGRREWFYRDEWDFLAARKAGNLGDLFRPHNEHWTTVPILVYRLLYSMFALRAYFPYRLVGVLVYLAASTLLFAVMWRARINPWIVCAAASLYSLFEAGGPNVIRPFQITFTGALAFALVDAILADHDGGFELRDGIGLVCGLLALMTSGVAVPLILAVGLAVLLRRGWRLALVHVAPLAVVYAVWWTAVGHSGTIAPTIGRTPRDHGLASHLAFVASGLRGTYRSIGRLPGLGVVLVIVLVAGGVLAWRQRRDTGRLAALAVPVALLAGTVPLFAITSLGRAFLGPEAAQTPRYLSIAAAMTLPALAVAVDALTARHRALVLVGVALFVVGISPNLVTLVTRDPPKTQGVGATRSLILTLPRDPLARRAPRSLQPDTVLARGVTVGWLLDAARKHQIPEPSSVSPLDTTSNAFRLSFNRVRGEKPATNCLTIGRRLTVDLRSGDAFGVYDGAIFVVPHEPGDLAGSGLEFLDRHGERVEVLRDAGAVQLAPVSLPSRPRVCFTHPVDVLPDAPPAGAG